MSPGIRASLRRDSSLRGADEAALRESASHYGCAIVLVSLITIPLAFGVLPILVLSERPLRLQLLVGAIGTAIVFYPALRLLDRFGVRERSNRAGQELSRRKLRRAIAEAVCKSRVDAGALVQARRLIERERVRWVDGSLFEAEMKIVMKARARSQRTSHERTDDTR